MSAGSLNIAFMSRIRNFREKRNAKYHKNSLGKISFHPFPLSHWKNRLLKLDPWI